MPNEPHISTSPYCDSSSPKALVGEKDACGVGFLAQIEGKASYWILEQALRGLECMEHRGGCGGDSDSGDGAGLLCEIPWSFFKKVWPEINSSHKSNGIGMVFMPNDLNQRKKAKEIFEDEAKKLSLSSKGWRKVPVEPDVLGPLARSTVPFIEQWLIEGNQQEQNLENVLFRLRKKIQNRFSNSLEILKVIHISHH